MVEYERGEVMDQNKIGLFIKRKRIEKGLTQEQLANILYVSSKTISRWERGLNIPDIAILETLAIELGVSVNELMIGEENKIVDNPNISIHYSIKERLFKIKKIKKYCLVILIISLLILIDVSYGYFSTSLSWQIYNKEFFPHGILFSLIFNNYAVINIEGIFLTEMFYIFMIIFIINMILIIFLVYLSYLETKLDIDLK